MWCRLCIWAIRRHRLAWMLAGAHPATWVLHEALIISVYGPRTYKAAAIAEGIY